MGAAAVRLLIRLADGVVNAAVLTFFLLLLAYGCYALWDSRQVLGAAQSQQYEIYNPNRDGGKSFQELQGINPEVIGWITVYDTGIDYPVTQAEDNEKYVNTDVEGNYSLAGSIFLDCRNKSDFSDFNSILYGHHMAENAMFGDLADFQDDAYFKEHRYGNLYDGNRNWGVELFAFLQTDAYDTRIYRPGIAWEEQQDYLETIRQEALRFRDIEVKTGERLLLLSTCTSDSTNGRHILVGKICDQVFGDSGQTQES